MSDVKTCRGYRGQKKRFFICMVAVPVTKVGSMHNQRWARSPPFDDPEDQDEIIQKCDLEDQIIKTM